MKTQYAVKYQLSNTHTGRRHDSLEAAAADLVECLESQENPSHGRKDTQSVTVVALEGDDFRPLTEDEAETVRYEANLP